MLFLTQKLLNKIEKEVTEITTEDLRLYLAKYKQEHNCSGTTMDTLRRVFSSFFDWLEDEDYIVKSPVRRIHRIKVEQVVKETISDEQLEQLKEKCRNFTDVAAKISEEKEKMGKSEEAKNDQEFMQNLMTQYSELQNNSINIAIATNNIDKIKCLQYTPEGVKVFYKS